MPRSWPERDALLAKAMAPLRSFDELELYQLSKASSTKQFLERAAGCRPAMPVRHAPPPRDDEFFRSVTLGGRYASKGRSGR